MNSCLLLIDIQEAWRDKNSPFYIGDLNDFVSAVNKMIAWAREKKTPIVFSLHKFKPDGSDILPQEKGNMDDFIEGNPRAEFIRDIDRKAGDIVFVKNRFSVFSNKDFDNFLKKNKIEELIVGGLITNCCVRATIIDAYNLGYKTTIVKEICASDSKETDEFTFKDLKSLLFGIKIVGLKDI
jgi:nicotinamidase-related amidase